MKPVAFGEGILARLSARVYTLLVVEALFVATTVPGLVLLLFLDRDPGNLPLAALCLAPVGPALSAAVYALHRTRADLTDLHPGAAFRRGYRLNAAGALRIWIPALAILTAVAMSLAHRDAAGVPQWWSALLAIIAVVVLLIAVNALVIVSLFEFRTGDTFKLAAYFLGHRPGVTLGNTGVLIAAAAVTLFSSEATLLLLASVLATALLTTSRPMIASVTDRFVR